MAWHGMAAHCRTGQAEVSYAAHVVTGRCRPPHVRGPVCVEPASDGTSAYSAYSARRPCAVAANSYGDRRAPARVRPAMVRPCRVARTEQRARVEPQLGFDSDLSSAMAERRWRLARGAGVMALGRRAQHMKAGHRAWFDALRCAAYGAAPSWQFEWVGAPDSSCPTCDSQS